MKVSIDPSSGFCFGVHSTIEDAETELKKDSTLFSLGEIVHNKEEMDRLKRKGLKIIDHKNLKNSRDIKVLVRAHGEPPSTYETAKNNNIELIDTTCPIVKKLQQRIHQAFLEMKKVNGQIVIYGKKGHPEVNGLMGQTDGSAILIEDIGDIDKIDFQRPIRLFSQTTKSTEIYLAITDEIKKRLDNFDKEGVFFIPKNTICRQVSGRVPLLKKFCDKNDVVVFVSGKNSSNGKYLFSVCKSANQRSFHVSSIPEIHGKWFEGAGKIGVSGATSTPKWLMESVAIEIEKRVMNNL
ncbi:MAG: 4-hydroxy-3-methylbut-2-enyl diphosphate reductase [Bacteroidetes bacterium]|nr:MAG: 4-hydroxy-3-methylbut-2-enyl diphosphate reductase [Bacteroidota bacterium]